MDDISLKSILYKKFIGNKTKYIFSLLAVLSAFVCIIASVVYYEDSSNYTRLTWIGWVLTMIFLFFAFFPFKYLKIKIKSVKNINFKTIYVGLAFFGLLSILFFVSHLWNFSTAPWNKNGLFDDASWDIYFAKSYLLGGKPFQAAVFLPGYSASREIIFHLYIIPFFKVFGFNLMTFNISLLILGFITYFFTTMLIHKLFKSYLITGISAVIFNFLPLHFIHTYVGHRYAIVAPLIMASIYFLYTGFKSKSDFRIAISSIFAGLCFSSAIMGKQYLYGLIGAAVLFLVFNFKKSFNRSNWHVVKLFVIGTVLTSIPIIIYIIFNYSSYSQNEGSYMKLFIDTYNTRGFQGIYEDYVLRMKDCLFGDTWYKWFLHDFPLLPITYYLLFIPGLIIAFVKKQYHFITLALIPTVGAFIAGFSDYRVLHSSPFWVIIIAFTLNEVLGFKSKSKAKSKSKSNNFTADRYLKLINMGLIVIAGVLISYLYKYNSVQLFLIWVLIVLYIANEALKYAFLNGAKKPDFLNDTVIRAVSTILSVVILLPGLLSSIGYLDGLSKNPNSVYHFNQKVVAEMRYLKDVVAGAPNPSPDLKHQEFGKLPEYREPDYDTLICQLGGYAIAHTFLYDYNDDKILSMTNGLPYNLMKENEILEANRNAILNYQKSSKNLKLIWEVDPSINNVIEEFKKFSYLGGSENLKTESEGNVITFFVLDIKNENIDQFKEKVRDIKI